MPPASRPHRPNAPASPWLLAAPLTALLVALLLAFLMALAPGAVAHGTFEANELEVHVLNDEGTDVMQEYGGYDVNELFVGAAHDPTWPGGGADGFYVRIEAYGEYRAESVPPGAPWRLVVRFQAEGNVTERFLQTTDGVTFEHDFDALLAEADGLELHVQRAFLSLESLGLRPGATLSGFTVASYVGDDLRDVAPGPLYVPGTGGAVPYEEPTALEGRGELVPSLPTPSPAIYLKPARLAGTAFDYTIEVASNLTGGGQHIYLSGDAPEGWTVEHSGAVSVEANGTATFRLQATPSGPGVPDLAMDLLTDVGGRVPVTVAADGTLAVGAQAFTPPPVDDDERSPAAGLLILLGTLGLAVLARSRHL